jgi:Phage portal protein, SPP1 Gp6-like
MPPSDEELDDQLEAIGGVIAKRARNESRLDSYYEGRCPFPKAIQEAKVTKAYRMLIGLADAPWGGLVVDSVLNRLEVTGISSGDKSIDDALMEIWGSNDMGAESKLAHNASLVSGRSFALVWPDEKGEPEIQLDNCSQMAVQYVSGSRRKRVAAMRSWEEGSKLYATLYRADGLYKYVASSEDNRRRLDNVTWEKREVEDEDWPLENPFNVVPVVELPVNRRLKPGEFGYARGEFEHCTSLIDRINLLTFLGLVVAFYMGFPLRGVIGEKIRREVLKDDSGEPILDAAGAEQFRQIPLFDPQAGGLFQLENANAAISEYKAADRGNLNIYAELDQLAAVTHTPRHYLPLAQGMTNLSADAIRASEGSLIAKIPTHKSSLGSGWEGVLRLGGLMSEDEIVLPETAELQWSDHETRSLAERADAAVKLKDALPQSVIAQYALNLSAEQLNRMQAERAGDVLSTLLTSAATPTPPVPPTLVPAGSNGAGA